MPVAITGKRRKEWLEQNVVDPDLSRLGEQQRVQDIIDEKLGSGTFHYRDELANGREEVESHIQPPWPNDPDVVQELAETVANEKVDCIEEQRNTIRHMGPESLRYVIHHIFSILSEGGVSDGQIARQIGLDKVTYSRFAGTRWGGRNSIPDLWANTAHMLALNPDFACIARQGLRDRIEQIVRVTGHKRHRRTDRD